MGKGIKIFWIGLIAFLVLQLLQGLFTRLIHDEAYYWVYALDLNWGYFHQPPGIAVFIKIGDSLLNNELGVRLMTILGSLLVLYIIYDLSPKKDAKLFWLMALALPFVQMSWLAVPDSPLLVTTAIFLWVLKRYIAKDSWLIAIVLGLIVAAMLYAKYHALIVLFVVLIPNIKLLRRPSFWLVAVVAVVAFLPHVFWQAAHDYPSYQYHWLDRQKTPANIFQTFNYLGGQILILGPVGCVILWAMFKYRSENTFERTLKWMTAGMLIVFLVLSFRSRIEANWTAAITIPMLVLGMKHIADRPLWRRNIRLVAIPSIIILLGLRLYAMVDYLPGDMSLPRQEMHYWDDWAEDIHELAGEREVVFVSSYQKASKYWYYTGQPALNWSSYRYGGSEWDLMDMEQRFQGKPAIIIHSWPSPIANRHYVTELGDTVYYTYIDEFSSYNNIAIAWVDAEKKLKAGSEINMELRLTPEAPAPYSVECLPAINSGGEWKTAITYHIFKDGKPIIEERALPIEGLKLCGESRKTITVQLPEEPGDYEIKFAISVPALYPGRNSHYYPIKLK